MLTRRNFMAECAVAGAVIAALPAKIFGAALPGARAAIVSIHMDQPYIDATGQALPYLPPAGMRAGAGVAHLNEAEFRRRFVYL
jgi:hypothetical protein